MNQVLEAEDAALVQNLETLLLELQRELIPELLLDGKQVLMFVVAVNRLGLLLLRLAQLGELVVWGTGEV